MENPNQIRCRLLDKNGEPYEVSRMSRFHICDPLSRPFPIIPQFSPGEIVFKPVAQPFRISLPVEVPGFGEVFLYADNKGTGHTAESLGKTGFLDLNYAFAEDRLATVKRLGEECKTTGIKLSADLSKKIESSGCISPKSRNIGV